MLYKTEFKSTTTHKIYTLELALNIKTSDIYKNIERQLLNLLELSHSEYKIILYKLTNERVEETDETCFANYCDCIEYPAFYFKHILYADLASNLQPINTTNLVQQLEPDLVYDSLQNLVSEDYNNDNINNTFLSQ